MADYDVAVLELTTPAATAPLAQCRPVVSVRNNGLHDAVASGYVRIYSAGLLIFESELYSDTIGPGETRPASELPDVTDLELIARKGASNGYAELDSSSAVPVTRLAPVTPSGAGEYRLRLTQPSAVRDWVERVASPEITSAIEGLHNFIPGMGLQELIRLELTAAQAKAGTTGTFDFTGQIVAVAGGGQSVDIQLAYQDPGALTPIAALSIPVASAVTYWLAVHLSAGFKVGLVLVGTAHAVADQPGAPVADIHYIAWSAAALVAAEGAGYFKVSIGWTAGQVGSTVNIHAATGQGVIRP